MIHYHKITANLIATYRATGEIELAKASIADIDTFLYKFKFFAQDLSCFVFLERDKNMQSLAHLGLEILQAHEIIIGLTYIDYSEGPSTDRNRPKSNVWIFGYNFNGDDLYIKLSDDFGCNIAKCISFHKADHTLQYPYKGKTK